MPTVKGESMRENLEFVEMLGGCWGSLGLGLGVMKTDWCEYDARNRAGDNRK